MDRIPHFAKGALKAEGVDRVEAAVRRAESRTTGEFVAVIVRSSCGDGHVPLAAGLSLLLAAFIWHAFEGLPSLPLLAGETAAAALLGLLLSRLAWVDRFFTPKADRALLGLRRAQLEFYQHGLEKTKGATGVLLFISLADHQAFVLADKSIASKVPAQTWDEVVGLMISGIREGDLAGGLERAIARAADVVRPHFPRRGRNRNELENRLIIKE